MKILSLTFLTLLSMTATIIVFDFNSEEDATKWRIIDDVVMGGRSDGNFQMSKEGHGVFSGLVSTENNGGFSSVRHQCNAEGINPSQTLSIRLKGDGKRYQARIKVNSSDYYSYVTHFSTSGSWETIEIPLEKMYPTFRGRKLNMGNFSETRFEEIGFLIGNKKNEGFRLEIDKIEIR